jgi:predicted RNA-binding Zn-ribbon protein involved in translation (DUF1610 family)
MQHRSYPTRPTRLGTPTPPAAPPAALHLVHGMWVASCPECGHELGRSRDQETAERAGERRRCPICRPEQPDLQAQLDLLVEWIAANGGFGREPS